MYVRSVVTESAKGLQAERGCWLDQGRLGLNLIVGARAAYRLRSTGLGTALSVDTSEVLSVELANYDGGRVIPNVCNSALQSLRQPIRLHALSQMNANLTNAKTSYRSISCCSGGTLKRSSTNHHVGVS